MRIVHGLVLAMGTYIALLNSKNVIEGHSSHVGYPTIGVFPRGIFILNYNDKDI